MLTMRTAAASIGPDERLVIDYRTRLDADTQDGIALTNVVGATHGSTTTTQYRAHRLRAHADERHRRRSRPRGRAHRHHRAVRLLLREERRESYEWRKPRDDGRARRRAALHAAVASHRRAARRSRVHGRLGLDEPERGVRARLADARRQLAAGCQRERHESERRHERRGLLDVRNLDLPASSQVSVQFDITLAGTIQNGTVVTNQADLVGAGAVKLADSDDPTVNGQSDPDVVGDEDPTRVTVVSAPYFDIDKISADIDGDATLLLAGERLQYTITVRNIGTSAATDTVLRDAVPANTTYVAGSTTLNGAAVADGAGGSRRSSTASRSRRRARRRRV